MGGREVIWARYNLAEVLPTPTPLTWSIVRQFMSGKGGFGEMFRMIIFQKVGTSALQSRATGGVAGGTYLFALPGSPGACRDGWGDILRWQLDSRHRPCNLVELMPRLKEHLKASA